MTLKIRSVDAWVWALTTSPWTYGPAAGYWMEDAPSGLYYEYIIDSEESPPGLGSLLRLLNKLNTIEYGCIYEQIESVRVKAK